MRHFERFLNILLENMEQNSSYKKLSNSRGRWTMPPLGKNKVLLWYIAFFCQASIFMVLQTIRHKRKKKFTSSLTLQSLVCLHCRVFLLCPPLHDSGFIDNVKCFTMCVQIKLIRHRKKRHVEEQKKIAKDVAAMWKLPQTNQYTIRQLFTVFENYWKSLIWYGCEL